MELPQYALRPNFMRIILPKSISLICLGGLFYIGILINLFLLGIAPPAYVSALIIAIIVTIIIIEAALSYIKASKIRYLFFPNRIEIYGEKSQIIDLLTLGNVALKKTFVDNMMSTGTILLPPNFEIKNVSKPEQMMNYAKSLIEYAKSHYKLSAYS